MKEFILAFPARNGNNWQHWVTYHCFPAKGEIIRHHTNIQYGGYFDDPFELAFEYDGLRSGLLRSRMKSDMLPRNFITGGTVTVDGVQIPIRFQPINVRFADGKRVPPYIESTLRVDLDCCISAKRTQLDGVLDKLNELFHTLSHSQVKFVADYSESRHDSLEGLYRRALYFQDEVDQLYPPQYLPPPNLISRCVRRFVRRHPTQATKRLLQMIAGASVLKTR